MAERKICTLPVKDTNGSLCVGIILAQDAVFLTAEGTPMAGVALTSDRARELANQVLALAAEIEHHMGPLLTHPPTQRRVST